MSTQEIIDCWDNGVEPYYNSEMQYTHNGTSPVIYANKTQAQNKANQLNEGKFNDWHFVQSPLSRRFYVKRFVSS